MRDALFDVIISVDGESDTMELFTSVKILDRYRHRDGEVIAEQADFPDLDDALAFARGAVEAFRSGS